MDSLTLATAPVELPVGLDEAKSWMRVESADDDALVRGLIDAARGQLGDLMGWTGLSFITQTYDVGFDAFVPGGTFILPRWPVQSVTSMTYIDANGATQTLATSVYQTDLRSMPARVALASGQTWPATQTGRLGAVTVRFVAGYGLLPDAVPAPIRAAIKALVAHWYESREPVVVGQSVAPVPWHVREMIQPYRLSTGVT